MQPQLSIIIASFKNPGLIKLCIEAIQKNAEKIKHEIIVVDGETEERTHDLMKEKFANIKFIPNKNNVGFGKLVNQGILAATGKNLFIINHDIIVKEKSLQVLLRYLEDNPSVGMVGPKLINFDNTIQPSCFRFYSPLTIIYRRTFFGKFNFAKKHMNRFMMKNEKNNLPSDVDWIMGSAMMISRSALKKVGKLDNRYFMYFEDVDWCWRFWKKNLRVVYNPLAEVFHYHGKASKGKSALGSVVFNHLTRVHIISGFKFFLKFIGEKDPTKKYAQTKRK